MSAARRYVPEWNQVSPAPIDGIEPPHDDDAEARVIEACLAVPGFIDRVSPPLTPKMFYRDRTEAIFRACLAVRREGAVDALSVIEWLRANKVSEVAVGARHVAARASLAPHEEREAEGAAKIVADHATLRGLTVLCQQATSAIYTRNIGGDVRKFVEGFEEKTFEICRSTARGQDTTAAAEGLRSGLKEILGQKVRESVDSGLSAYRDKAGPLRMGEYSIIGASSGQGKTAWGLNVAVNVAIRGEGVLYVSTEMTAKDLMLRAVCAFAGVPYFSVIRNLVADEDKAKIVSASARFKGMPLHVDDNFGQTIGDIRAQARRIDHALRKDGKRLRLVIVDYFQDLAKQDGQKQWDERELVAASRSLKDIASAMQCHVLALSQLSEGALMQQGKARKPELGDLKGAKGIAFPAEVVGFLHREKVKGEYLARGPAELWIRKARFAPGGNAQMTFDAALGRFEDSEEA